MTDLTADPPQPAAARRQAQLASALQRLRTRARGVGLDRWLAIAGGVLLPLGAVWVLLGWYGAAHTSRVYLQIPYLISGGVLGLGLMFAGGFCYFAFWITRLVHDERAHATEALAVARETAAALGRIEQLLAGQVAGDSPTAAAPAVRDGSLVATPTGSLAHRPGCPMVRRRVDLRTVAAGAPGLRPCTACAPHWPEVPST